MYQRCFKLNQVLYELRRKIDEHLEHAWLLSKGLQPEELMKELHPALQTDLFEEYVGDALTQVCNQRLTIVALNQLETFVRNKTIHRFPY